MTFRALCITILLSAIVAALTATILGQYYKLALANRTLALSLTARCYSTQVGEIAALVIVSGEIVCMKRYDGIPTSVWNDYVQKNSTQKIYRPIGR
jgi:hypothetical protein